MSKRLQMSVLGGLLFLVVSFTFDRAWDHGFDFSHWFGEARPLVKWLIAAVIWSGLSYVFVRPKQDR